MSRSLDESSRRSHNDSPPLKRQANSLQYSGGKTEGYDEYFDPPLENKYECPICLLGLREPVQTECGHRFCRACILRSLRDAGNKCPVDNVHLTEAGLYPDNFAKREMNSFTVWCRHKKERGCPWKGPLGKLEDHMKKCEFADVKCPNSCGTKVQLRQLEEHMEKSCPKRKTECPFCHQNIFVTEAQSHNNECPEMPLNCEKCGKRDIPRKQMANHVENDCPKEKSKCPLHYLGCKFEGFNPDVSKHISDKHVQHFKDIAKAVQKLQEQASASASAVARSAGPSTSQEPPPTRPEPRPVSHQTEQPMRSGEAQRLMELVLKLEDRVTELEGRVSAGTFIWKIDNFRYRRSQAIDNTVPAIHSPPFYTSLYGYKMCLRMNLNGVDSGFGHHLSLFVHMMRGDWDDILDWPFTGRITLAILDQSENVEFRRPISETLVAKPNLLAFQKPTSGRNHKGYGYVEFCQIEQFLRDGQFVKNDVMLVRIQVFH